MMLGTVCWLRDDTLHSLLGYCKLESVAAEVLGQTRRLQFEKVKWLSIDRPMSAKDCRRWL